MRQNKIILFLIILFVLSSLWLSFVSQNSINPDYRKNWWAVSFSEPKGKNLDFTIENHSDKTDFHWMVLHDGQKIEEGDVKIEKGTQAKLSPTQIDGKVTIEVSVGDEKKEIYKNL